MPAAERTITIAAPIEKVFAFFTNPENDPKWRDELVEVNASGPYAVGAVIKQVVSAPVVGQVPADIQITAFDPPNNYAFKAIAGPVRPEGSFTLTEVDGGTSLTMKLSVDIKGPQKFVLSKPAQGAMNNTMKALDKVKAILEG